MEQESYKQACEEYKKKQDNLEMDEPIIRELEENDFKKGFLNTLDTLQETSNY